MLSARCHCYQPGRTLRRRLHRAALGAYGTTIGLGTILGPVAGGVLIQASIVNGLADPTKRIEPLLGALALVEEVSNRFFDQFVAASIVAISKLLFDLSGQIRRQRDIHDRLLFSFYAFTSLEVLTPSYIQSKFL